MQQFFQTYAATPNYSAAGDLRNNFIQSRSTTNNSNSFQIRTRPPLRRCRQRLLPLHRASRGGLHSHRAGRVHLGRIAGQELRRRMDPHVRRQHGARRARRLCGPARRRRRPAELSIRPGSIRSRKPASATSTSTAACSSRSIPPNGPTAAITPSACAAPRPAREPQLERHAEPDLAQGQPQHPHGLLVHRRQAHPAEHLPDLHLRRRPDRRPRARFGH